MLQASIDVTKVYTPWIYKVSNARIISRKKMHHKTSLERKSSRAALALTLISTSITVLPTESNLLGTISINCKSTSSESAAKDGLALGW